jgi:hypothetical protein
MARDLANLFSLVVPEHMLEDAQLPTVSKVIAFDDLGDFVEERERIRRKVEQSLNAVPRIDFSDFSNHVFFDSALSKFNIAKNKILEQYPYAGNSEENDAFVSNGSLYEQYVLSQWPRYAGYINLTGNQYVSASDVNGALYVGSSSLYVSVNIRPAAGNSAILQNISGTSPSKFGYELLLSGSTNLFFKFNLYSGSQITSISAAYASALTESFNTVAAVYDQSQQKLNLYLNKDIVAMTGTSLQAINFGSSVVYIGSGSGYASYQGDLDEVRVLHTSSAVFHEKNYVRPISSEDYVKLYYKFNESYVGTSSIDSTVIDYSKNAIHGTIANYSQGVRVSGTSMTQEPGDLILYSFHSGVAAYTAQQETSASIYDAGNRNYIFRLIPERLLEQDQDANGLLISFSLAMARYFDELKMYVDQFDNLRITNYGRANETPDLMLPMLKNYFGWKVTDHFGDANPLEFFFGENVVSSGSMATSLQDIRNEFWRRILNNLPYLYKSKGKRTSLDAYFNVLGLNKNILNVKEYGFLKSNSIADEKIVKEKPYSFLGIGTGSYGSGSYVKVSPFLSAAQVYNEWTIESYLQLPYDNSSYTTSLATGSIWQFVNTANTRGYALIWTVPAIGSVTGSLILTASDGQKFTAPGLSIFNGQFVHIAAGMQGTTASPFITVRTVDNGIINYSASFSGSTALSSAFTQSMYDFVIGASSGSLFRNSAQGYFGPVRYWSRELSGSELDAHALNIENIGLNNPLEVPNPLVAYWSLSDNKSTDSSGQLVGIDDLSRRKFYATGLNFPPLTNPYKKFLVSYSYISPSIDLKWTENKIRIRNQSEITIADVATDTNQVSLEFNLVDALNEDISKIFSSIESLNTAIGAPINKYRDSYADLESYRRVYFDRLSTSLNFTNFFKLFRWFDKKLALSIKQLLPARVNFIGGEFVVESHFLERNKYQYLYPLFKTPRDIGEADIHPLRSMSGAFVQKIYSTSKPLQGTHVETLFSQRKKYSKSGINIPPREASVFVEADLAKRFVARTAEGNERRSRGGIIGRKVSGDTIDTVNHSTDSSNFRNEYARKIDGLNLFQNRSGYHSDPFIHPSLGNGHMIKDTYGAMDPEHYLSGIKKAIPLVIRGISGSTKNLASASFRLVGATGVELSQSLWDVNNVPLDTGSFTSQVFGLNATATDEKNDAMMTFSVSASSGKFNSSEITVRFKDSNSQYWQSYQNVLPTGIFLSSTIGNGWMDFHSRLIVGGAVKKPRFSFNRTNVHWMVSSSTGKTYVFKDFKLTFNQSLTDYGVQKYNDLDNQNNTVTPISRFIMRPISPSVLAASGSGLYGNAYAISTAQIVDGIAIDRSYNIYLYGHTFSSGDDSMNVLKLVNNNFSGTKITNLPTNSNVNLSDYDGKNILIDRNNYIYISIYNDADWTEDTGFRAVYYIYRSTNGGKSYNPWYTDYGWYQNGDYSLVMDSTGSLYRVFMSSSNSSLYNRVALSKITNTTVPSASVLLTESSTTNKPFLAITTNDVLYYLNTIENGNAMTGTLKKSVNKGQSWTTVYNDSVTMLGTDYFALKVGYNNKIIVMYMSSSGYNKVAYSNTGDAGSYQTAVLNPFESNYDEDSYPALLYSSDNNFYSTYNGTDIWSAPNFTRSISVLPQQYSIDQEVQRAVLFSYNDPRTYEPVFVVRQSSQKGGAWDENIAFYHRKAYANSNSLGPAGLNTSYTFYRQTSFTSSFKLIDEYQGKILGNVSEFPHYGGIFQMKNIILGTQSSGRFGKTDDSIVQVRYIGSVVRVMWPDQSKMEAPVKGFGELSIGQSPGMLTTEFQYGDLMDVTEFDHMSLYCYLKKTESGSLDDVVIQIQRRPLRSLGFATDQTVEYVTSGTFTEARYRDILHTKEVDYGDLTVSEIGYPIDIPLTNVREVRIGARHKNGQDNPENRNFIAWARLIKSAEET